MLKSCLTKFLLFMTSVFVINTKTCKTVFWFYKLSLFWKRLQSKLRLFPRFMLYGWNFLWWRTHTSEQAFIFFEVVIIFWLFRTMLSRSWISSSNKTNNRIKWASKITCKATRTMGQGHRVQIRLCQMDRIWKRRLLSIWFAIMIRKILRYLSSDFKVVTILPRC